MKGAGTLTKENAHTCIKTVLLASGCNTMCYSLVLMYMSFDAFILGICALEFVILHELMWSCAQVYLEIPNGEKLAEALHSKASL